MQVASSHRVLRIVELLEQICKEHYLEEDPCSLLAMALTCKAWTSPAFKFLWRTLSYPENAADKSLYPGARMAATTPEFRDDGGNYVGANVFTGVSRLTVAIPGYKLCIPATSLAIELDSVSTSLRPTYKDAGITHVL